MDWAESYNNLCKTRSPTGICTYSNGSSMYYTLFEEQFLNIARLFMNLINTFSYKLVIVIYNIVLKGICKGEKTKGEREKRREKRCYTILRC